MTIRWFGLAGAIWGLLGIFALVGWAVIRLSENAWLALDMPWSTVQWGFFVDWLVFMIYGEGYRGFQKGFSPRVVARAVHLARNPVWWHVLLAPAYCMGFVHATPRRRLVSILVTSGIVVLVLLVSQLPQPWHGIVDFGVVAGLVYGLFFIAWYAIGHLLGRPVDHPADVPEGDSPASVPVVSRDGG
ncbi:MAG: hypothetical protein ACLFSG_06145 [Halothiobacillaceae bacterium]